MQRLLVILSTLPHLAAMYWAVDIHFGYAALIGVSTGASVCWHVAHEPRHHILFYIDYGLAGLWTITDLYFAKNANILGAIIALNSIALITNHIHIPNIPYEITHSLWHGLSCAKACLVAYILNKNPNDYRAS